MNLEDAKVGDVLVVSGGMGGSSLETVERLTKTLVITNQGKWRKQNGRMPGADAWSRFYAKIATSEDIRNVRLEIARQKILRRIEENYRVLSTEDCMTIMGIINRGEHGKEEREPETKRTDEHPLGESDQG